MTAKLQNTISIILDGQTRIEDCLGRTFRTKKPPRRHLPIYYEQLFRRDDPGAKPPPSDPDPEELDDFLGAVIEKLDRDFLTQTATDWRGERFIGMQIMYVRILSVFANTTYLILYSVIFRNIRN
jgi:hypothetical protein